MKYVILVTVEGQHLPVLFPDTLTHSVVAKAMGMAVHECLRTPAGPYHAGFVSIGTGISVGGESESLGLKSYAVDTIRIIAGEAVSHMPDDMLGPIASKLNSKKGR